MYTYQDAKAEYRLTSDGDDWGNTMQWWFHVADEIYWNRDDLSVPDEWHFKPSPIGPQNDPDEYETEIVREMPDEDLLRFGRLLDRYASRLKRAGKDY